MLLFSTSSTEHLASKLDLKKGKYCIKHFSDGEIHVQIQENVSQKNVVVLANTLPPAENLLELFFLLDALSRAKAKIHLFISYFAYARQDRLFKGQAFTGGLVAKWLEKFNVQKISILHMHSSRLKKILTYEQCIDLKQFCSIAKKFDMLIAPDRGAIPLVKQIGASMKLPTAFMKKIRIRDNKVKIAATNGNVRGKNLLIVEDMICTGSTIITASKKLLKQGAKSVCVLATHGVFSQNALKKLESSPIQTIYVTNSIKQKKSQKLKILDISPYIREEISKA